MKLSDMPLNCCICSGGQFSALPFGYRYKGKTLNAIKCESCATIFIHPQPSAGEIAAMYGEDYFTSPDIHIRPHGRSDYINSVGGQKESRIYQARLKRLARLTQTGTMLEIGCGPGHFLKAATEAGWQVTGIEISDFAARYAREQFGLQVYTGTLDSVILPEVAYDVIFMGDLLEHLTNPKATLLGIKSKLKPTGIILIEVPSMTNGLYSRLGSAAMRMMRKTKLINLPPYHLFEFNPKNIQTLLTSAGFEMVSLRQGAVLPWDIGLHESGLLNGAKITLQTANYLTTIALGFWGDRLTIIAKPAHPR